MELGSEDIQELQRLEEGLWRAETRFDPKWMEDVVAPDFYEFGRSGRFYEREDTLAVPMQPIDAKLPLKNFTVRLLGSDVAQVTYISAVTFDGIEEIGRRSSIWSRTDSGWQLRFHQGTAIPN